VGTNNIRNTGTFNSGRVAITHPHGYDSLSLVFQYREKGRLENSDFVSLKFRACEASVGGQCGPWSNFNGHTKRNDVHGRYNWSQWTTRAGGEHAITLDQKFVEVQVKMKNNGNEWGNIRNTRISSNCNA